MNKIHKTIWSRCANAFVVVSELATSRASGRNSRMTVCTNRNIRHADLTPLAASLALVFGLGIPGAAAMAQTVAAPGGNAATYGPGSAAWVDSTDVNNTAYGNALLIQGNAGDVRFNGGKFSITPTAPNADRNGDDAPYAAIRVEGSNSPDQNYVELGLYVGSLQIDVTGDNLHGIYLEENSNLRSYTSEITATGDDVTGLTSYGKMQLTNGQITATGDRAAGIRVDQKPNTNLSHLYLYDDVKVTVEGKDAIGIDIQNGAIDALPGGPAQYILDLKVTGVASGNATGMRFDSGQAGSLGFNNASINVIGHADGNGTTGIALNDLSSPDKSIAFGAITVDAHGGKFARGIEVGEGLSLSLSNGSAISVSGQQAALGVDVLASASATITASQIKANTDPANSYDNGYGIRGSTNSNIKVSSSSVEVGTNTSENSRGINLTALHDGRGLATVEETDIAVHGELSQGIVARYYDLTVKEGTQIAAHGKYAQGIWAQLSDISVRDTSIATTGNSSTGMWAQSSNIEIADSVFSIAGNDSTGLAAQSTTIDIRDASFFMVGNLNIAVDTQSDTTIVLTDSDILLDGDYNKGVQVRDEGFVSMVNTYIDMAGTENFAVFADRKGRVEITDGVI